MELLITCGHCQNPSPIQQWTLVQTTLYVGDLGDYSKIMEHTEGRYEKEFSACSLICPLCKKEQTVLSLEPQNPQLRPRVAEAGIGYAVLFASKIVR